MDGKIKILFLAANPRDTSRLSLDEEIREILKSIRGAEQGSQFTVASELALRPQELPAALMRHRPDIVHFSGHGTVDGTLCLVNDATKRTQQVSTEQLVDIFRPLGSDIRCVVLSACYSAVQAQAIASCVSCVVGMSRAVKDQAATAFAAGFYEALAFGKSVQTAFELGRAQMGLLTSPEPALGANQQSRSLRKDEVEDTVPSEKEIPQLLLREGVDATKLVLAPTPRPNPWAAILPASPHPAAALPGSDKSTKNIKINSISMAGIGNTSNINQNDTYMADSTTSASLADKNLEVGDLSIGGTGNFSNINQIDVYGGTGTAAATPSAIEQARLLVQNLANILSSGPLTSFQKKQALLAVSELKDQLSGATPDRTALIEPLDALRLQVAAAPALTQQLDRLSELIKELRA